MEMETTNEQSWCLFKYFHNGCIQGIFPRPLSRGFKHNHQVVFNFLTSSYSTFSSLFFFFFLPYIKLCIPFKTYSNSPGNDFTFKEHFAVHLIFNIQFFFHHSFFFFFPYYLQLPERLTAKNHALFNPKNCVKITGKKKIAF